MLEQGFAVIVAKLVEKTTSGEIKKQGVWASSNLCKGEPSPSFDKIKDLARSFCYALHSFLEEEEEEEIVSETVLGLSCLTEKISDEDPLIPMDLLPIILQCLEYSSLYQNRMGNITRLLHCLKIIGDIISKTGKLASVINS